MINFIQKIDGSDEVIHLTLDDDSTIHDSFRTFISFLKAQTYGTGTIYHGLLQAIEEVEETLECDYKTFKDEILPRNSEVSEEICEELCKVVEKDYYAGFGLHD